MNDQHHTIETAADIEQGLLHLSAVCPTLKSIIAQVDHVPLRRTEPGFASLASIIISQQVSKQSADAIFRRLESLVDPLTPEKYLKCGEQIWIKVGLSRPKQRTFSALCQALIARQLDLDALAHLSADEATEAMTQIKGIGPWTAQVYLLFALGHRDIFPAGDLALQQAATDAYGLATRETDKALRKRAESWSPWRGVAARLLWAYYADQKGRSAMP